MQKTYQVTVTGTHFAGCVQATSAKKAREKFLKQYKYEGSRNLRVREIN